MDLHPYDGVQRRFRHTDQDCEIGRSVVAHVLRIPAPPVGELLYDLSFYSGGIGVLDHLAIGVPADPTLWSSVTSSKRGRTPEEASADSSWAMDLIWLLTGEEDQVLVRPAAVQFINKHRREFQAECVPSSRILFGHESDVNDWSALWGDDTRLNYLGYSQG